MIKPLRDNVLLKMIDEKSTTQSGIIISAVKEKSQVAEVIAVGDGIKEKDKEEKMYIKVGDKVLLNKFAGTEIKFENEEYIIIKQAEILAMIE